jgi:hypothetical protein
MPSEDTRIRSNPVIAPPPASPASRERRPRPPAPRKPRVPTARRPSPAPADAPRIDEYADAPRA